MPVTVSLHGRPTSAGFTHPSNGGSASGSVVDVVVDSTTGTDVVAVVPAATSPDVEDGSSLDAITANPTPAAAATASTAKVANRRRSLTARCFATAEESRESVASP